MITKEDVPADFSIPRHERFVRGILLICKYTGDPDFAAEHDIFYFGAYESTIAQMTEEEQRAMFSYNWIELEDSWAFFT